jgi:dTDP-4-dehydrorhamnose reductase
MTKILVTGSEGQLGQCIQNIAIKYPELEFVFRNSKTLDITDGNQVVEMFSNQDFNYCFNCAAYTNVEQAEKTPELAFAVNAEGAKIIAVACAKYETTLLHISTDYVFDGEKEEPYTFQDKTNPINEYGRSKLQGEIYIQEALEQYFLIRTSWLYSEFGKNFYKTIVEKSKNQSVLKITDQQTGCPTNANNLAEYMVSLVVSKSKKYGIHHFTDGEAMTWYDFAKHIIAEIDPDKEVRVDRDNNYRTFAKRPKNSTLK